MPQMKMIIKYFVVTTILIYCNAAWSAESGQTQEIQVLKQQIQLLLKRVEHLEQQQRTSNQELAAQPQSREAKPEKDDGLQWEVGGYAKLDGIFSSNSAGANSIGDEFLVNGLIPAKDSRNESNQIKITARESRVWVKTHLPISEGNLKTYLEGDFLETSQAVPNYLITTLIFAYGRPMEN